MSAAGKKLVAQLPMTRLALAVAAAGLASVAASIAMSQGVCDTACKAETEIRSVVQKYIDSMHKSSKSLVDEAFHPAAKISGYLPGDSALHQNTREAFGDFVASQMPSPEEKGETPFLEVVSIKVHGTTAVAKVRDNYLGMSFTDTLSLLQEEGKWSIYNKIWHVEGTTTAEEEIHARIKEYFDGMMDSSKELIETAFHAEAKVTGYLGDELLQLSRADFADYCAAQQPSPRSKGDVERLEVVSLEVTGNTAIAFVRDAYLGHDFLDTLSFLYADGKWSIYNKLFIVE